MPTHAELASKLLSEAAGFFRTIAAQNPEVAKDMSENASVFAQMADLLARQPTGMIDDKTHGQLAGQLLKDAAVFFRTLGEKNQPIAEQMDENARVFEAIADLVTLDATGMLD
jgi:hypothetical protein